MNTCMQGVETANHAGHCPINLVNVQKVKLSCIQSMWGQDKSSENRPKCPAVGSLFPHSLFACIYTEVYVVTSRHWCNNI